MDAYAWCKSHYAYVESRRRYKKQNYKDGERNILKVGGAYVGGMG